MAYKQHRMQASAAFKPIFIFVAGLSILPIRHSFAAGGGPAVGTPICGQPILQSPYNYNGAAGPYTSGTAGLPTYGTPTSDFPKATAGVVVPPETHDYPSYELNPNTVYY